MEDLSAISTESLEYLAQSYATELQRRRGEDTEALEEFVAAEVEPYLMDLRGKSSTEQIIVDVSLKLRVSCWGHGHGYELLGDYIPEELIDRALKKTRQYQSAQDRVTFRDDMVRKLESLIYQSPFSPDDIDEYICSQYCAQDVETWKEAQED